MELVEIRMNVVEDWLILSHSSASYSLCSCGYLFFSCAFSMNCNEHLVFLGNSVWAMWLITCLNVKRARAKNDGIVFLLIDLGGIYRWWTYLKLTHLFSDYLSLLD
jgi:hypothetical protein